MKKYLEAIKTPILCFSFSLLFGSYSLHSQSYLKNFKSDICNCLQEKDLSYAVIENEYSKCFRSNLVSYTEFIDSSITEEDQTQKYIKGQKIRKELELRFQHELMYSCEVYFYTIERAFFKEKQRVKQSGDSIQLQKYKELVAMNPNWQSYLYRGLEYYKLNDLKNAERDALKSIELSPYNNSNDKAARSEKLFLAQVYEDQNRFSEAINIYDQISLGDMDTKVLIIKAIAVRRRDGRYNPPKEDILNSNTQQDQVKSKGTNQKVEVSNESIKKTRRRSGTTTTTTSTTTSEPSRDINKSQNDSRKEKVVKPIKSKDSTKNLRSLFKLD